MTQWVDCVNCLDLDEDPNCWKCKTENGHLAKEAHRLNTQGNEGVKRDK